jgi:hypothetical protein
MNHSLQKTAVTQLSCWTTYLCSWTDQSLQWSAGHDTARQGPRPQTAVYRCHSYINLKICFNIIDLWCVGLPSNHFPSQYPVKTYAFIVFLIRATCIVLTVLGGQHKLQSCVLCAFPVCPSLLPCVKIVTVLHYNRSLSAEFSCYWESGLKFLTPLSFCFIAVLTSAALVTNADIRGPVAHAHTHTREVPRSVIDPETGYPD